MTAPIIDALRVRDLLDFVDEVCRRRGVTREELCGRGRTQAVVRARQELWWQLRQHPERHYSLCEIGRLFGRDHSTVLHGIDAYRRRLHDPLSQPQQP
jgi:chromosomal replication initiation ATPase DnaA